MIGSCTNRCVSLSEVKSLLAADYSLHAYTCYMITLQKKKGLFRTFGFCISRIIDIPRSDIRIPWKRPSFQYFERSTRVPNTVKYQKLSSISILFFNSSRFDLILKELLSYFSQRKKKKINK